MFGFSFTCKRSFWIKSVAYIFYRIYGSFKYSISCNWKVTKRYKRTRWNRLLSSFTIGWPKIYSEMVWQYFWEFWILPGNKLIVHQCIYWAGISSNTCWQFMFTVMTRSSVLFFRVHTLLTGPLLIKEENEKKKFPNQPCTISHWRTSDWDHQ